MKGRTRRHFLSQLDARLRVTLMGQGRMQVKRLVTQPVGNQLLLFGGRNNIKNKKQPCFQGGGAVLCPQPELRACKCPGRRFRAVSAHPLPVVFADKGPTPDTGKGR